MSTLSPEEREAFLKLPASIPPPGEVSNLVDPPNLVVAGYVVVLMALCWTCLFFAIRVYTKVFVIRSLRMSDYAMAIGWGLFMGYFAPAWLVIHVAPGIDQWNMSFGDLRSMLWYYHVGSILAGLIILFIKISILLQFLEIFSQSRDFFFWSCHAVIWMNIVYYTINTFLDIFGCDPINKAWDFLITEGTCVVQTDVQNLSASVINCASDLVILVLPQTKIWRLQMSRRKKLAVSMAFLVGVMACTAAIVKLAYSVLIYKTTNNASYFAFLMALSSLAEISCGIIAGCLPCTPRFVRRIAALPSVERWTTSIRSLLSASSRHGGHDSASTRHDGGIELNDHFGHKNGHAKGLGRGCDDLYPLTQTESLGAEGEGRDDASVTANARLSATMRVEGRVSI
ncbi:hypothetical protein BJY04DRAFT_213587 [Aspergillus karnatakaensis]|uniref:uncharacterized protein n=1 Tax=Aspergillus karnatakaensis TaxID=1810916 RepID=UPI003CCD8A57